MRRESGSGSGLTGGRQIFSNSCSVKYDITFLTCGVPRAAQRLNLAAQGSNFVAQGVVFGCTAGVFGCIGFIFGCIGKVYGCTGVIF